jgi:hypothetical protein
VNIRYTGQLALKLAFIAVCAYVVFGGNHPPATAQARMQPQYVPVITAEDAVQDNNISALNKHLENTDATAKEQWLTISQIQNDISGMRGEERIIGAVLGVIASSGVIMQWRRRPVV